MPVTIGDLYAAQLSELREGLPDYGIDPVDPDIDVSDMLLSESERGGDGQD